MLLHWSSTPACEFLEHDKAPIVSKEVSKTKRRHRHTSRHDKSAVKTFMTDPISVAKIRASASTIPSPK
jgi:hypothetical protein